MEQAHNNNDEVILPISLNFASIEHSEILTDISLAAKAYWGYDSDFIESCREELTITPKQIANNKNIFLVKNIDGEICGFVFVKPLAGNTASLEALFIRPEHIGCGYGTELLNAVKLLAKERCYEKLVINNDPNAAGFYEKMGAVKTGQVPSGSIEGHVLPQYELLV